MSPSPTHLVLLDATGSRQDPAGAVAAACAQWQPVWVVVDRQSDLGAPDGSVRVVRLKQRGGRGHAIRHALLRAERSGFTHALVMAPRDIAAAVEIPALMALSLADRRALVLAQPGRRAGLAGSFCNLLVGLETGWAGIGEAQCGLRVYPVRALLEAMAATRWMRGPEFEAEAAVRLCWRGTPPLRHPVPGATAAAGLRGWMHLRLFWHILTRR